MPPKKSSLKPSGHVAIPGLGELIVEGFHLEPTYRGFVAGSILGINRAVCSRLPERAGTIFYGKRDPSEIGMHFVVPTIEELKQRLPGYVCMALLRAEPIRDKTYDDDTLWSEVVCCWFADDVSQDINFMILAGIRPFAWEKFAKNDGI